MSQMAMNIFFKQELEKRQNEYMQVGELKILTYTWNVNGQKPPQPNCPELEDVFSVKNLALDLCNLPISSVNDIPDLIVFNFQEIVPLNAKSMLTTGLQPQLWEKYLLSELNHYFARKINNGGEEYMEKLASHVQMGLFQVVLVKRGEMSERVVEHQLAQVGTGILGVGGNKGAIGCSIKVCETKIAIVNAHLAASQSKVQRRNQNVN